MTPSHLSKLISSLEHRKRMSQTIDSLESEIIAFLIAKGLENKPIAVNGWELLFDGKALSISEAPVENFKQMELFERSV